MCTEVYIRRLCVYIYVYIYICILDISYINSSIYINIYVCVCAPAHYGST